MIISYKDASHEDWYSKEAEDELKRVLKKLEPEIDAVTSKVHITVGHEQNFTDAQYPQAQMSLSFSQKDLLEDKTANDMYDIFHADGRFILYDDESAMGLYIWGYRFVLDRDAYEEYKDAVESEEMEEELKNFNAAIPYTKLKSLGKELLQKFKIHNALEAHDFEFFNYWDEPCVELWKFDFKQEDVFGDIPDLDVDDYMYNEEEIWTDYKPELIKPISDLLEKYGLKATPEFWGYSWIQFEPVYVKESDEAKFEDYMVESKTEDSKKITEAILKGVPIRRALAVSSGDTLD